MLRDRFCFRFFRDMKLKYKMIVSYSTFIILPILFTGLSSYYITQRYLEESEKKSLIQSMFQLNNAIDYFLDSYMNSSGMLFNNIELQQDIKKFNKDIIEIVESHKKITNVLSQIRNNFKSPEITNTYYEEGTVYVKLFVHNHTLSADAGDILPIRSIIDETWYKELFRHEKFYNWQSGEKIHNIPYIVLNRRLMDFEFANDIGIMRIYIPAVRIKNIIQKNVKNDVYRFYYVDQHFNNIVKLNSDDLLLNAVQSLDIKNDVGVHKINREKYVVGVVKSGITDWRLIYVLPYHIITRKTNHIAQITMITILCAVFLCILVSVVISSFITRRLDILVRKVDQIKEGNIAVTENIQGNDEFGRIDRKFNNMILRINLLIENEYKSQIQVNKTKLELLQQQINPHLLYNTLSAISRIARQSGQAEVFGVTTNLVAFYKGILNRGKIIASIKEELNMVKTYIEIMKFVYGLDLDVIYEIDNNIFGYYTIKLILQPIVENAILHGLRPNHGGVLHISSNINEESLEFSISDNGIGMTEEISEYLNNLLKNENSDKSYGLSNVIRRINLFFGDAYGVRVVSSLGSGTKVKVTIPKLTEDGIKSLLTSKYLI